MTLDYTICPHCGCRCEDDEFCAACGKLFHDDPIPSHDVSILGALGSGLQSQLKGHSQKNRSYLNMDHENAWTDPSWSSLPGNMFHQD